MSTYSPPDTLIAAVLSDLVYHSGNEAITPPLGWEKVDWFYDPDPTPANTGYYGEAWAKLEIDADGNTILGSYTEIMQVNRGTVFSYDAVNDPAAPANIPGVNLNDTAANDHSSTILADELIVLGQKPDYLARADDFYDKIKLAFPNLPVIEAGHSLGGAASAGVVADKYAPGVAISAITFNALPYGRGIAELTEAEADSLPIVNFYVGNEQLTQSVLGRALQWISGGTPLGVTETLPDLPILDVYTQLVDRVIEIHDAPAAVSQLFQSLYPPTSPDYAAALVWLEAHYPDTLLRPAQINAVIGGTPVPTDTQIQSVVLNLNDTVSIITGGDGSPADAQQIATFSHGQAAIATTFQVTPITPNTGSGEQAVWETDVYDSSKALIEISQSKAYIDGSFAVYTYSPSRVLQSIYSADTGGDSLIQTFSAAGELSENITLKPDNTAVIQQYKDDPILISEFGLNVTDGHILSVTPHNDGSVLVETFFAPNTPGGSDRYIGVVANMDGSTTVVDGPGKTGTTGQIASYPTGGLWGNSIGVSPTPSGGLELDTIIANGGTLELGESNSVPGVIQNIKFSGPSGILKLDNPVALTATISNFMLGDSINLAGVPATAISLGTNNVLTVQKSDGGVVNIQFDPTQNLGGRNFGIYPDGSGGTDVSLNSLIGMYGSAFNGSSSPLTTAGTFGVIDPMTGTVNTLGGSYPGVQLVFGGTAGAGKYYFTGADTSTGLLYLYGIDIKTGALLSKVLTTRSDGQTPFAADGTTGELVGMYGSAFNGSSSPLTTAGTFGVIDPMTGTVNTLGGSYPGVQLVFGGTAGAGKYYFTGADTSTGLLYLYGIDIKTGALLSKVLTTRSDGQTPFAADGTTGELVGMYGSAFNGSSSPLTTAGTFGVIDPMTGTVNTLGGSYPGVQLVFGGTAGAGKYYFTGADTSTGLLYLYGIDIKTGALLSKVLTTRSDGQTPFASDQPSVACFVSGTHIDTKRGEIPVEQLRSGDTVRTEFSNLALVKWIGHRRIDCSRHPDPRKVWPVRVSAGVFGADMPRRDLWLSPDHAVFEDGVLIPIKYLINGCTITQEPRDDVTYYHIELDQHDVLFAEGLPAESYLDTGDRFKFSSGGGPAVLHPDFSARVWEVKGCAPLVVTGSALAAIRARLSQRAAMLGSQPRSGVRTACAA